MILDPKFKALRYYFLVVNYNNWKCYNCEKEIKTSYYLLYNTKRISDCKFVCKDCFFKYLLKKKIKGKLLSDEFLEVIEKVCEMLWKE